MFGLVATFCVLYAQNYSLNFGTDTGMIRCTVPYTGTTVYCSQDVVVQHPSSYSLRFISPNTYLGQVSPQKCQFEIRNPGDPAIGSGSEVQFWQGYIPDLRMQVSDFTPSPFFSVSFKLKISKQSTQQWSYPSIGFYFGSKKSRFLDKTKTIAYNRIPEDTAVFGAVYFNSNQTLPNYYNALDVMEGNTTTNVHVYPTASNQLIAQGVAHTVEFYANTSIDSIWYQSPTGMRSLGPKTYHFYVDSIFRFIPMKNIYYRGGDISAFSWYVKSPNQFAPIIIDDIQWSTNFSVSPLPVKLIRFDAEVCQRTRPSACLSWETELEIDNDYFSVERSEEGISWKTIGHVVGFGTTTIPHSYLFEDQSELIGTYYYRLKQVDFDGDFEYSPIRAVSFGDGFREGETLCDVGEVLASSTDKWALYDFSGRQVRAPDAVLYRDYFHGLYVLVVFDDVGVRCRKKVWIE